jgi:hypothetical protein
MSDRMARLHAHPLRDRLLFEYQREPISPSKLARRLGERVNLVSYHTGVLARSGCLELVRTERRRGATEHFYRSLVALDIEDDEWQALPRILRRSLVLGTLAAITEESRRAALDGSFDERRAHMSRSWLELDDQAMSEVSWILRRVIDDIARVQAECREREPAEVRRYELAMLHFAPSPSRPMPPDRIRPYRL